MAPRSAARPGSRATAVVIDSGCAGFKTDRRYRDYRVATTDGGRTWVHL
jgi:hypothetical protein